MKVIGVTGGVGAGKSRILEILQQEYGAQVILADQVAKELEAPGCAGYIRLVKAFGEKILSEDKTIDREAFAGLIFQDKDALKTVNELIHPMTWQAIKDMVADSRADLIAVEAALFDGSSKEVCDQLWLVDASEEIRIKRLMDSRGYSREKTEAIMANQPSREAFLKFCDQVIDNNGTVEEVLCQIRNILEGRYQ